MAEERRIQLQKNGPYRLMGPIPLTEMAPVHTLNGEPVAWHTLRELPSDPSGCELCRCGKSSNKPFCDKSHESGEFDGTETASREPYEERAGSRAGGGVILADDMKLCMSAGFCGTRTTNVWKLLKDPDGGEQLQEMVWNCPSGRIALYSQADGAPIEPDLPQEVAVLPGGPLWVRGAIPIIDADGNAWQPRNRVTLCRCGESRNKPFCDGTHASLHFDER